MIKLFLFLLLFISSNAFSTVYESNPLSMRLEEKEHSDGSGYELLAESGFERLYLDGALVREKVFTADGYRVIEDERETIYTLDGEGRIINEKEGDRERSYNYSQEGLLLSSSVTENGEIVDFSAYFYDSSRRLVRIDKIGGSYIFSESNFYFSTEGDDQMVLSDLGSILSAESSIEETEDGNLRVLESDGKTRVYANNGKIIEEIGADYTLRYYYGESGDLEREERESGNIKRIQYYENGKLVRSESYENGVIVRLLNYGEVRTETRFRNGEPYALLTYEVDGRSIKDLRLL